MVLRDLDSHCGALSGSRNNPVKPSRNHFKLKKLSEKDSFFVG